MSVIAGIIQSFANLARKNKQVITTVVRAFCKILQYLQRAVDHLKARTSNSLSTPNNDSRNVLAVKVVVLILTKADQIRYRPGNRFGWFGALEASPKL